MAMNDLTASTASTRNPVLPKIPLLALLPCLILASCGDGIPDCNDPKIREMVADVVEDRYDDAVSAAITGAVMVEISDARMVGLDPKTKAKLCVGRAKMAEPSQGEPVTAKRGSAKEIDIDYEIEPSDLYQGYSVSVKWPQ